MKASYSLAEALAVLLALVLLALAATSCTEGLYVPTKSAAAELQATRADSTLEAAGLRSVHKLVIRGNVTIQAGTGNTNTSSVAGKQKTKQRAQALSTGDNSPVTASQKKGGLPWWVYALVAFGGAVGWEYLSHQLKPLGWLRWRAPTTTS